MDPIDLRFRYTLAEYMQAARVHFATRLRLPLDIAVVLAAAALGAYLTKVEDPPVYGPWLIDLAGAFAVFLVLAFTLFPYLLFRNQPNLRDEYTLTFTRQDIHFKTVNIDSTLQWRLYKRVLVSDDVYLLYHGPRAFSVVPKRAFASIEQQASFEKLLENKVPRISRASWWGPR